MVGAARPDCRIQAAMPDDRKALIRETLQGAACPRRVRPHSSFVLPHADLFPSAYCRAMAWESVRFDRQSEQPRAVGLDEGPLGGALPDTGSVEDLGERWQRPQR